MIAKLLFLLTTSLLADFSISDPIVQLPNGKILGRKSQTLTGNPFYSFQKIPYATPPIHNLRFKAPVPPINWNDVLDTSNDLDVICLQTPQHDDQESEDCLYLNVFTPRLPLEADAPLPVMFYIFGGGFTGGDSRPRTYGPEYLIDDGVVVVTINYRLGPFGFLSTGDAAIPGNNGLKDQLLALQWTHDNIALFGGNPAKITIFGESAGAVSVGYHLLHTQSEGLFVGAILQSGSALMPFGLSRYPRETAFGLGAILNETFFAGDDSNALLLFLQGLDVQEVDQLAQKLTQAQSVSWVPVIEPDIDGALITQKMYVQFKSGDIIKVPCLIGINSEEAIYQFRNEDVLRNTLQAYDNNLESLVPDDMIIDIDNYHKLEVGTSIRDIYTGGEPLADNLGAGVRLSSDTTFNRGLIKQAELQSAFADVYFYQFSYDGLLGGLDIHYDGADSVGHTEDLHYIWHDASNSDLSSFPESDQITQKRIQKIWSDFAKFQNPTPAASDLLQNIIWPKVTPDEFLYVDINEDLEIKSHPKSETYGKWVELYDSLGKDDFDTY